MQKTKNVNIMKQRPPMAATSVADEDETSRIDWNLEPTVRHIVRSQICRRIPTRDVDDVLSETVFAVMARLDERPADCPFRLWVKGIARNHVRSYRRRHPEPVAGVDLESVPAATIDVLQLLANAQYRLQLAAGFHTLTSTEFEQLRKFFVLRWSFRAIAANQGEKLSSVTARHYRSLRKLQSAVAGDSGLSG